MLVSGFTLFGMSHHHEIWVDLMAGLGGGTCVFSMLAVTIQSRIVSGRIQSNLFNEMSDKLMGLFYASSWAVMIGIILVLGIVSYRI